jgi:hypothetical protein
VVGCYEDTAATVKQIETKNNPANKISSSRSFLSRINPLSRRKMRRRERTKQLLLRLKEVGDLLQQQQQQQQRREIQISGGPTIDAESSTASSTLEQVAADADDIHQLLSNKCTIVEMPMMQVIHKEDSKATTTTSLSNSTTTHTTNKGDLCFFAGSGFDSLMLHDFQQIKAWSSTSKSLPTFLKDALSSVAGYCVALVTLTLPQTLRYGTHKICVRVTTTDEGALWIDHRRGDFAELAVKSDTTALNANGEASIDGDNEPEKKKKKHLLYSGSTGILAASTTPYYGGGLRLFPYARLIPNKMQLRLGRISPLVGFFNIPKIFEGSYREKSDRFGCLDFVGEEFDVEVSSPVYEEYLKRRRRSGGKGSWWRWIRGGKATTTGDVDKKGDEVTTNREDNDDDLDSATVATGFPFQHSGESMGIKERFRLRVVKQPVRFVSFLRPRVIVDE